MSGTATAAAAAPKTRRPKGGKGSALLVRVTADIRAALDEEAEVSGQSLSQIAERRLSESLQGKATFEDRLNGSPTLMHLVERFAEIERAVRAKEKDAELASVATYFAWNYALKYLAPLKADLDRSIESARQREDATRACKAVFDAIAEAADINADDPVVQRAIAPLKTKTNPLQTDGQGPLFRALLPPDPQNAYSVTIEFPGEAAKLALRELLQAGMTARAQIDHALALVEACIERTALEVDAQLAAAERGKGMAAAILGIPNAMASA